MTYDDFLSKSKQTPQDPLSALVEHEKTVYVFALTRDSCSGCETQKPLYEKLASSVNEKQNESNSMQFTRSIGLLALL